MSEEKDYNPNTGEDVEASQLVQAQTCEVCAYFYSYKDCDNWKYAHCKFHGNSRLWTHKRVPMNSWCCHFKDKRDSFTLSPEELEKMAKLKEIMEQKAILMGCP